MSAVSTSKGCAAARPLRWLLAATLALGAAHDAGAVDFPGPVRWAGAVTVVSETIRRGVTWSGGRPAVGAALSAVTDQGWSASIGVDAPSYPEVGGRTGSTLAAARSWQLDADWVAQASLTRYDLTGRRSAREAGYTEFGLTAGWQSRAFFTAAVSPDRRSFDRDAGTFRSGHAAAADIGITERLAGRVSLDAGLGFASISAGRRRGYAYGSVGLRWSGEPLQLQVGWVDSQAESRGLAGRGMAGRRLLAQASCAF